MSRYDAGVPTWIDLGTTDPDAAMSFYGGLLGWTFEVGPPETGGYTMALKDGKMVAGLYALMPEQLAQGIPPAWTTYLASDDADASVERVVAAGGQVLVPPMDVMDAGRMAVVADPAGAVFGFWQAAQHTGSQLANEPGSFIWNELYTTDFPAAKAFYADAIGWELEDMAGDFTYTTGAVAGRPIAGMMPMPAEMQGLPSHWATYFAVDSCEAATARARELGGEVLMEPMDSPYGRWSVLRDPQGASFMAMEAPPAG